MKKPAILLSLPLLLVPALSACTHAQVIPAHIDQNVPALFNTVAPSVVDIRGLHLVVKGTTDRQTSIINTQGSGVIVSADGTVLTVAHLVQSADEVTVKTANGEDIPARVLASEPAADVALLQLERMPPGMSVAVLGNSDEVKTGQPAIIVGAPYGLHPVVTVGHISGRHHTEPVIGPFEPTEMFQTDAGMHLGSSGAPLFNMKGEVIGIATQIMTTQGSYEGLGFAVTSNTARSLLLEKRSLWSGIECYRLSGGLAQALNLPQSEGLLVQRVASHSPGSRLGLQAGTAPASVGEDRFILGGDIILSMQGISLAETRGYERARAVLATLKDGERLFFKVLRAGKVVELQAPVSR